MASQARIESGRWLRTQAAGITGPVLSIGSGDDRDGKGGRYRHYFTRCRDYTTSEPVATSRCDLVLDVRHMPEIADAAFDGIFCGGVLEQVDDPFAAMAEMTRILRPGGVAPPRPAVPAGHPSGTDRLLARHRARCARVLLEWDGDIVEELAAIDATVPDFPATYWTRARRTSRGRPGLRPGAGPARAPDDAMRCEP